MNLLQFIVNIDCYINLNNKLIQKRMIPNNSPFSQSFSVQDSSRHFRLDDEVIKI